MKLSFLPLGDAMPLEPYAPMAVGQPARRIGRKFNPETGAHDLPGAPYVCESGSKEAARCLKLMSRDKSIRPADEATAKALGVAFTAPVAEPAAASTSADAATDESSASTRKSGRGNS